MCMACSDRCSIGRTGVNRVFVLFANCRNKGISRSGVMHTILIGILLWSCVVLIHGPSAALSSQDEAGQSLNANKTLERTWDPVIVENKDLQGVFDGEEIKSIGLYAYTAEGLRIIPFQIDLIGEDGMVIPGYVNRVMKKAVYDFIPNKDRPTTLSGRYQVLFMTKDTGGRYPGTGIPEGFLKGCEIELRDPVNGGMGWVYLMKPQDGASCTSPADYVDYKLIKKDSQNNEQIKASHYVTGFPDANKPFAYGYWIIPENAGGTGVDILETFRVKMQLNILGMKLDLDPKNNIIPFVLSYNDGPIRVTRRGYNSVVLGGLKMDWIAKGTKLETESHYYSRYFYFDGEVSLPGFVKKISKINAFFTTDFTPKATGLLWLNSVNTKNGGCLVDGIMSPEEVGLKQDPYQWSLMVGQQGGWANILTMHSESMKSNMELFYLDDMLYKDETEPSLNGTWASTGYSLKRIDKVEEKVTFRTNIFAIPRDFKVSDMKHLTDLVYQPVKVRIPRVFK